ncbi:MAG: hypothetical protein JO283_11205 [Bradyrhizobium sp.]|nr:hypothetical protein [Bradyrhizobium sp.]
MSGTSRDIDFEGIGAGAARLTNFHSYDLREIFTEQRRVIDLGLSACPTTGPRLRFRPCRST